MKPVIAVEKTDNSKTGIVSVTYAPMYSCPKTCPFLNHGCYGQSDFCGIHTRKINEAAKLMKATTPFSIAKLEAEEIKKLSGLRPLRLHVVGDCRTSLATQIVSSACEEHTSKHNQPVWTYTHAWREVPRNKWRNVSVLASCETFEDVEWAWERGYAVSMVRAKPFDRPFLLDTPSKIVAKMIPCLEVTRGTKCINCKLCFNDKKLLEDKRIVCFFPHGAKEQEARDAIFSRV